MTAVLINGALGKMGRMLADCAGEQGITVAAGIDVCAEANSGNIPMFASLHDCREAADALIDFSRPAALDDVLDFALSRHMPLVLATTGYSAQQEEQIRRAARMLPIFRSANFSLGVNVLATVASTAAGALQGFDIEIVEKHHKHKVDAPSGTALMLCDAIEQALPEKGSRIFGRSGVCPRKENEIGLHAVRGGSVAGEHELYFFGEDEVVTLTHSAASRKVFAIGALRAARFIAAQKPGLYNMQSMLNPQESLVSREDGWSLVQLPADGLPGILSVAAPRLALYLPGGELSLAVKTGQLTALSERSGMRIENDLSLLCTDKASALPSVLAALGIAPRLLSVTDGKASVLLKKAEAEALAQELEKA